MPNKGHYCFNIIRNDCLIKILLFVAGGEDVVANGGCQVTDTDVALQHDETWWSEDRCTECHCKSGVLECQNSHCTSCVNPHYLPGHCCPVCNGECYKICDTFKLNLLTVKFTYTLIEDLIYAI
jgi:hypothetical protein